MSEILTITELAEILKMTKRQVYELCRERTRATSPHPIPLLRINGNTRFRRADIEQWLDRISQQQEAA